MKHQSSIVLFHYETLYDRRGKQYIVKIATHSNKGKDYARQKPGASDGSEKNVGDPETSNLAEAGWRRETEQLRPNGVQDESSAPPLLGTS